MTVVWIDNGGVHVLEEEMSEPADIPMEPEPEPEIPIGIEAEDPELENVSEELPIEAPSVVEDSYVPVEECEEE